MTQNGGREMYGSVIKDACNIVGAYSTGGGAFLMNLGYDVSEKFKNNRRESINITPNTSNIKVREHNFDWLRNARVSVGDYQLHYFK